MNAEERTETERELRAMTEWGEPAPGLWRAAMERAEARGTTDAAPAVKTANAGGWLQRPLPFWAMAVTSAAAVLLIAFIVTAPHLGRARSSARSIPGEAYSAFDAGQTPGTVSEPGIDLRSVLDSGGGGGSEPSPSRTTRERDSLNGVTPWLVEGRSQGETAVRSVARRATVELRVADVRTTVLKARQLVSEARGEYVETANVHSSSGSPQAELVLRVEASRLESVLSDLRELGEVLSERIDAEDVTDRIVDLDARLANDRRVEQELLNLLSNRENDKLDDILAVRRELASVRQQIERLTAQRDQIGALVHLSRIAVAMTGSDSPEPQGGLWSGFVDDLGRALGDGLTVLLATVTGLVRVLVGGLPWFALATIAGLAAWRSWRRTHPRSLPE